MKIISFYNEKGGVGKSTFSIMYASWLHKYDLKVAIIDFNNRDRVYRNDEINFRKENKLMDGIDLNSLYPIVDADKLKIMEIAENRISHFPNAYWLEHKIRTTDNLKDRDVVIVDLPGAVQGQEFMDLLAKETINMYCIIFDRDPMTTKATIDIMRILNKLNFKNVVGVINQVTHTISMDVYNMSASTLNDIRLKVLPDMISFSERMKNINKPDIIRSTLRYPDWDNKAFEGSRDLGFDNFFIDFTKELDKCPDLKNTPKTDFSFVYDLKKEFQDRRQLVGTKFPEYEFPLEMFPLYRQKNEKEAKENSKKNL